MAKKSSSPSRAVIKRLLKAYFIEKHDVLLVFLFGSSAGKRMTSFSDIDIGLLFKKLPDIHKLNNMQDELRGMLKRDIDLIVLNEASPIIRMQIIKTGTLALQRDGSDFSKFYGDTVKQYDDLKIIRKKCEDNILKGRIYA